MNISEFNRTLSVLKKKAYILYIDVVLGEA